MTTTTTQQVKLRTRVYSDVEVRNPVAYYNSVFGNHSQYWTLLESDDSHCILVETRVSYDVENIELVYDRITPEMYQSTSRSYVKV